MIKYAAVTLKNSSANKKREPAALTNAKQDHLYQIHADNIIQRSEVGIKNKYFFFLKEGHAKKFKTFPRPLFTTGLDGTATKRSITQRLCHKT